MFVELLDDGQVQVVVFFFVSVLFKGLEEVGQFFVVYVGVGIYYVYCIFGDYDGNLIGVIVIDGVVDQVGEYDIEYGF